MAASVEARLAAPEALPKIKRDQQRKLEEYFRESKNPTDTDILLIGAEVGLTESETRVLSLIH